ncbi:putative PEP-binding protein, partial [Zoogloea ramigera]|uniref:putative PEP-binding protein n=1 Tax=Zoogloea ramigera TaxID=350 RepID=UPI003FA25538
GIQLTAAYGMSETCPLISCAHMNEELLAGSEDERITYRIKAGVPVSVGGEMAGAPDCTRLLIGMGLRQFSMHPAQILEVKQSILRADAADLGPKVQRLLKLDEPDRVREAVEKL